MNALFMFNNNWTDTPYKKPEKKWHPHPSVLAQEKTEKLKIKGPFPGFAIKHAN